jgi:hypothetical protein
MRKIRGIDERSRASKIVSYQGRVLIDGNPYNGTGYFKFAITDESVTVIYWGNDGIAPPSASIPLYVDNGFFNINLGDETLPNMVALSPVIFSGVDRYLQVWFSSNDVDFTQLPVTRITSVPYALVADTLDGLDSTEYALFTHDHDTRYYTKNQVDALLSQGYDNVIIVAKSGGDYTTLGEALSNISDAAADNLYLVWITPGIYEEKPLQLLPYVHIQGSSQEATQLLSATSDTTDPPDEGSLMLAPNSSLRDLTVINLGDGPYNTAILASPGVANTYLSNLKVSAEGSGSTNFVIYLDGSGVKVDLDNLQVTARNGTTRNCALIMRSYPQAIVHGGSYLAEGNQSYAFTLSYGAVLTATHTTGMAVGSPSFGLNVRDGSRVVLEGGSFTSKGYSSSPVYGINTSESDTSLIAEDVKVIAEGFGTGLVHGLRNRNGSTARLTGVVFHASGGTTTYGILNESGGSELTANDVQVSAIGAGNVHGLNNSGSVNLVGGNYYAEGGNYVFGIYNDGFGSRLDANDVSAHGKFAMFNAFGLYIDSGNAILTGGEYIGETGSDLTCGIYNQSQLFATGTSASGFFGLGTTYGLRNASTARLNGAPTWQIMGMAVLMHLVFSIRLNCTHRQ